MPPTRLARGRIGAVRCVSSGLTYGRITDGVTTKRFHVTIDAGKERFHQSLPYRLFFQHLFISGVADKGYFCKDGRHISPDQDDKGCASNPAVVTGGDNLAR